MSRKLNHDEVAVMPMEELDNRYRSLVSYIERERRRGNSHMELEIDACYLYRELDHRHTVQRNHVQYLKKVVSTFHESDYITDVRGS